MNNDNAHYKAHYKPYYRQIKDPIASHARPLIALLEQRIKEEFGFEIMVAFEKEMQLYFDKKTEARIKNDQVGALIEGYRARKHYPIEEALKNTSGANSVMQAFHHEENIDLYEFKTQPTDPLRAVTRIDGQVQMAERFGKAFAKTLSPAERTKQTGELRRQIAAELGIKLEDVQFKPYNTVRAENMISDVPAGLHVNFSLWEGGRNLMSCSHSNDAAMVHSIHNKLYAYMCSDMLVIAPDEEAVKRLNSYKGTQDKERFCELRNLTSGRQQNSKRVRTLDDSRLEFRTPAANTRHDLATLMVLLSIYEGLKDVGHAPALTTPKFTVTEYHDIMQSFEHSSRMVADLRAMTKDNIPMSRHVDKLREEVIRAVRGGKLAQPSLAELHLAEKSR
jgi:glutamine synthetase